MDKKEELKTQYPELLGTIGEHDFNAVIDIIEQFNSLSRFTQEKVLTLFGMLYVVVFPVLPDDIQDSGTIDNLEKN